MRISLLIKQLSEVARKEGDISVFYETGDEELRYLSEMVSVKMVDADTDRLGLADDEIQNGQRIALL